MTSDLSLIHVGFTGSQHGLWTAQTSSLEVVFFRFRTCNVRLHHGDCIGSDSTACQLAVDVGFSLHAYPGLSSRLRANFPSDFVEEPDDFLVRNRRIIAVTSLLIACPEQEKEKLRSGTWATIRYAREAHRNILYVWPSGRIQYVREDLQAS